MFVTRKMDTHEHILLVLSTFIYKEGGIVLYKETFCWKKSQEILYILIWAFGEKKQDLEYIKNQLC